MKKLIKRILKEEILSEGYGEKTKFYHATCQKHLSSLLKGVKSNFNLDRVVMFDLFQAGEASKSQGGGFYVSQDVDFIKNLTLPMSDCKIDTMVEIEVPITKEYFDLDYELFPNICEPLFKIIENSGLNLYLYSRKEQRGIKINKISDVDIDGNDTVLVSDKDISNEKVEIVWDGGTWVGFKLENGRDIGFITPKDCSNKQPNMKNIHSQLESMDVFGIKDKLEETLFDNLPKKSALKYKGPTTKVTNYWIRREGKWVKNPTK